MTDMRRRLKRQIYLLAVIVLGYGLLITGFFEYRNSYRDQHREILDRIKSVRYLHQRSLLLCRSMQLSMIAQSERSRMQQELNSTIGDWRRNWAEISRTGDSLPWSDIAAIKIYLNQLHDSHIALVDAVDRLNKGNCIPQPDLTRTTALYSPFYGERLSAILERGEQKIREAEQLFRILEFSALFLLAFLLGGHLYWGFRPHFQRIFSDWTRLEGLIDASDYSIVITDLNGTILRINRGFENLLGYPRRVLENQATPELFHDRNEILNRAEEIELKNGYRVANLFEAFIFLAKRGEIETREWTYVARDGRRIPVLLTVAALRNNRNQIIGYAGIARDISRQKENERKLQESQRLLAEAQAVAGMGSFEIDFINGQRSYSRQVYLICGADPDKPAEFNLMSYILNEDRTRIAELLISPPMNNGEQFEFDFRIRRNDGEILFLHGSGRAAQAYNGKVHRVFCTIQDITERKRIETELIEARDRAETAIQAKALFLSTMSHEIRTPMNAVIGLANFLLSENPRHDQIQTMNTLKFSAESLLSLINDILDFSRIEAGRIELESVLFDLRHLINSIKAAHEPQAKESGNRLIVSVDPGISGVISDPHRLGQILNNLLSNANKFTHDGEVEISLRLLDNTSGKQKIRFTVRDTGIGIAPEQQQKIFEIFAQADAGTTRQYGGSGLGLTITRGLLKLFESDIHLESLPGKGSAFSFDLEIIAVPADKLPERKQDLNQNSGELRGMSILLAEDNTENIFLIRKYFEKWGIHLIIAENGKQAVDAARNGKFDVILMDLQMPELDGYEATREIRKSNADIPVICLTADAFLEVKEKALACGMNDYISKPFNPNELFRTLQKYRFDIPATVS